jgi:predicted porin
VKTKFYLKPSVLAAAVAAAVAVAGSPAYALDVKISGQVNRGLMMADDGTHAETINVDNDRSSTRFRFTGSETLTGGVKAGIVWEVEQQSQPSNLVDLQAKSTGATNFIERKMELYFEGGFGKVSLGQGEAAMDGGVQVDLSGTGIVAGSAVQDVGGAVEFRTSAGALSGVTIGDVLSDQDFEGRYDRTRYDSPALGPITLSASTGQNGGDDVVEYGFRVNTNLGGGSRLAAAYGISSRKAASAAPLAGTGQNSGLNEKETTGGSLSILLGGGLSLTFGMTNVENDPGTPGSTTTESDFTYFKIGQKMGKHAVSLDFGKGEDQGGVGNEGEHIGVQWVWSPVGWADIYGSYGTNSLDVTGASFDDINILFVGSNIKF